jgi:Na+/H+ antiporter NhaA
MSRTNRGVETLSSPLFCNKKVSISNERSSLYQIEKLVTITVSFGALVGKLIGIKVA